ncbi:M14 metallopeptidase family protein [candidate division KSB1 bacterium]
MRLTRFGPALYLLLFFSSLTAQPAMSPGEYLGFDVGEDFKLADWKQITGYYQTLGSSSPRIKVDTLGLSTLGKPLILVTITSEENQRNIEEIRQIQAKLADPRGLSEAEEADLLARGKVVLYIGCALHSTEVASTQMTMEMAHDLATGSDPLTQEILDNVIILLAPSQNPDGHQMICDWYRQNLGTPFEGGRMPWMYHPYVGHDNNRDWYMLSQAESRILTRLFYKQWHPQIMLDMHQMGNRTARLFVPPYYDPVNPYYDPVIMRETALVGDHMTLDLTSEGFTGVITHAMFDMYLLGYMLSVGTRHNMVGLLTEAASCNIASPIFQRRSQLSGTSKGLPSYDRQTTFPDPWPGGWWRLKDIMRYEEAAVHSLLRLCSRYRDMWLGNFLSLGKKQVERGENEPPYAFVLPENQRDPYSARTLVHVMQAAGVEAHEAGTSFTADGRQYPAGSLVIKCAQPYRAYICDLLEIQEYPLRLTHPGGPPEYPYDAVGWTLGLQMGVEVVRVVEPFEAELSLWDEGFRPVDGSVTGRGPYVLRGENLADYLAVNRCIEAGLRVERARDRIQAGGGSAPPGAFIISGGSNLVPTVNRLSKELGLSVIGLGGKTPENRARLREIRLGVYQPWTSSMDEGWTRWVLERFEFPYKTVHNAEIQGGNLARRFDAILIPDIRPGSIINGVSKGGLPSEYTGGIGRQGLFALMDFVREGGSLITLGSSSELVLDNFDIEVTNPLKATGETDNDGKEDERFFCPGSLLRVHLDVTDPLAYGMPEEATIFFSHSPAFQWSETEVDEETDGEAMKAMVAKYPGVNPLQSGWILNAESLQGKGALARIGMGSGEIVLFGFKPQYRASTWGTFKLLFNSIYNSVLQIG